MRTAARELMNIYTHPIFYEHDTGIGHPENASRIDAAVEGVRRAGLTVIHDPAPHDDTQRIIAKVHSADYERQLDDACRSGMRLFHSLDNPISAQTFAAARAAVATALTAAADTLGLRRGTVKSRLSRALGRLRQVLPETLRPLGAAEVTDG